MSARPKLPASSDLPKLAYSMAEACKAAGLGRTFLFGAIRDGRLNAVRAGGRTLVTTEALHAFLDAMPPARGPALKTKNPPAVA